MRTISHVVVCAALGLGSLSCQPSNIAATAVPDVTSASEAQLERVELSQNAAGGPADGLAPQEEGLYQHIKSEIANYKEGEPLEPFLARLHIQDAPFDWLYCNQLDHEDRVYHLGRFFLRIDVEHRDGGLYTGYFSAALHRDGLTREQRLQEFNRSLGDYFREKQERLESNRPGD